MVCELLFFLLLETKGLQTFIFVFVLLKHFYLNTQTSKALFIMNLLFWLLLIFIIKTWLGLKRNYKVFYSSKAEIKLLQTNDKKKYIYYTLVMFIRNFDLNEFTFNMWIYLNRNFCKRPEPFLRWPILMHLMQWCHITAFHSSVHYIGSVVYKQYFNN